MRQVKTLGLLGTGVIGGGWAARALHFGIDVVAADVKPEMEAWIRGAVANAEGALSRLTFAPLPPKGRLSFTTDLTAMARQADFIQENIPEQLELKQRTLALVSRHAPRDVLIASSTSGLMPTELASAMEVPERFLVAHPFNPVYLLPLVELVGGEHTTAATLEAASRFYRFIGMHPLTVRREVPGHLTDRLQEALWREILHLVNDGVATTGELDDSIVYGPGLRWAGMGTNLIYHLAGGEPGMRHMLRQFGPCLKWPWTKLEAPELTEQLIDSMVEGTQAQAAGRSIRELERLRDDYLVAIQQVLRQFNIGAGATLRALEERLYEAGAAQARPAIEAAAGSVPAATLRLIETEVRPEWVDYNGHMTDSRYLQVFGDATDALLRYAGVDDSYRRSGRALYTVETHVMHQAEARALEPLYVLSRVLEVDDKRLRVFHALHRRRDDVQVATAEQLYLHVTSAAGKASSMDTRVRDRLAALQAVQASLPVPPEAGRLGGRVSR
ncbi:MAG TPA: 3-hydroxyacyl-CoA dehydrogenase NAD-binding domain-containing protein [Steroidobacteraceae bacterium]|jgi:carnitine 3-dehydrogenase|nr:3-hydroxyacyl-CoA dehydrogenase NAD-binding domain-containing protein [Steroidobacteraceae bacterium]